MKYIYKNKLITFIIVIYVFLMISVIEWGIPGPSHPFNYQMDEWHQLQAVRTTFNEFSSNVPGSAHGTMLHFILSGIYLIPFFVFGVINPFVIKSSTEYFEIQHRLFEILRMNTLLFGILSIIVIAIIAKKYLKSNPCLTVILFAITPLWLSLSNYFKYDIALLFWINLSILYILKFGSKPTLKNYLIAGAFCGLAFSTKISSFPLLLSYVFSFFLFSKERKFKNLFLGSLVFIIIVIFLGIPDLILGKGDYREFLYSNLISGSRGYGNIVTGLNEWWQYVLFKIFPIDFGYLFYAIYVTAIFYWSMVLIKDLIKKKTYLYKKELFLLICFLLFILSLIPLKLGANGNRLLVLLPFFALLSSSFIEKVVKTLNYPKWHINILIVLFVVIQFYQSIKMVYIKWLPDVREVSSKWMKNNIERNSLVGIENIPIYQLLPDIIVKEFYLKDKTAFNSSNFKYQIIDSSSSFLPATIVITNTELEHSYYKNSAKKELVDRIKKEGYESIIKFKPSNTLYSFYGNELDLFNSGLVTIPTITIFKKKLKDI